MSRSTVVQDASFLKCQSITHSDALIEVYQNFEIRRFFTVAVEQLALRGNHAHLKCNQLILVIYGEIQFEIYDGKNFTQYLLTPSSGILHVPPGLWTVQKYLGKSQMIVMCDQVFDDNDYIRDWNYFVTYKNV